MRVHELAKELGRPSREVISVLQRLGIPVISHANTIDDVAVKRIKQWYAQRGLYSEPEPEPEELEEQIEETMELSVEEEVSETETLEAEQPQEETVEAESEAEEAIAQVEQEASPQLGAIETTEAEQVSEAPEVPSAEHEPHEPAPESVDVPAMETQTVSTAEVKEETETTPSELSPPPPPQETTPARPRKEPEGEKRPVSPPRERRRRKRSFREEAERAKQRRDYVDVRSHTTRPAHRRGGASLMDFTRTTPKTSQRPETLMPPPPPKPTPRKRQRRTKEEREEYRRERERELKETARRKVEEAIPKTTEPREIVIPEGVTVKELAQIMGVKAKHIIQFFLGKGHMLTLNHVLPTELAEDVALEFGFIPTTKKLEDVLIETEAIEDRPEDRVPRPPVVTVMGHVDHGKTTLLDTIRKTNVAAREAGGITQQIGAYQVEVNNRKITFIDTPGHEAFTQMRARGAKATDIVILVVAADDGVMPQTIEAIDHARAADTPIVVAINKIDKPNADPDKVKRQLAEVGLLVEEWGGDTVAVPISAKKGQGIDELLEMVLLVADLLELKANPTLPARGIILESRLDPRRGPLATVLVQNGTLNIGDVFVAGSTWGRVRAMFDYTGQRIDKATPSTPVEVLGFENVPEAGDIFQVVQDEARARRIAELRQEKKLEEMRKASRIRLDDLHERIESGEVQELPIILKADTQGSLEALRNALEELSRDEVKLRVIHAGVGGVTASDVMLAAASNAIIIGFNVRADRKAREDAEKENVEIRYYSVIYDAIEDIKSAITGLLKPKKVERLLGVAEVRQTFRIKGVGVVAGCFVREGKVVRGEKARLLRDNVVLYDGKIESLKRFKDDVREVPQGYECGLTLSNYRDIKVGDLIEVYHIEEVAAEA